MKAEEKLKELKKMADIQIDLLEEILNQFSATSLADGHEFDMFLREKLEGLEYFVDMVEDDEEAEK